MERAMKAEESKTKENFLQQAKKLLEKVRKDTEDLTIRLEYGNIRRDLKNLTSQVLDLSMESGAIEAADNAIREKKTGRGMPMYTKMNSTQRHEELVGYVKELKIARAQLDEQIHRVTTFERGTLKLKKSSKDVEEAKYILRITALSSGKVISQYK